MIRLVLIGKVVTEMTYHMEIPKDKTIDSSLALLMEGYRFIPNRRRKFQSDIFEINLMAQKVVCISGPEAASVFYDERNFKRQGAAPKRIQKSIFGQKGVQTLDDEAHIQRKSLFMSLFTEARLEELKTITEQEWHKIVNKWVSMEEVNLFAETKKIMCKIACNWAAVPLQEKEVAQRANDLWALIDAFGAVGPRHWQGRMARKRCDTWTGNLVNDVRSGKLHVKKETPLYEIAWHRDTNGELLDQKIAAVEVINIIRPIVAISLYVLFGAVTLYTHPQERDKIINGGKEYMRMFTEEIRRYYPFTPFLGARVRREFEWNGYPFKQNKLVLLDVYGMNHDYRIWERPSEFDPERFKDKQLTKYNFIPQGGGEFIDNHRCAGELVTIAVMDKSFEFLTKKISYHVPKQDLLVRVTRMPPMIQSGFLMKSVKERV